MVNWLPGQEAGNGLADVLFGEVNPYARLHVTMPNKDNEGKVVSGAIITDNLFAIDNI